MDKSERTKKYIIEKASPIFNRKGFRGTSLSDIIEATKLSKGSIYGNFGDKNDIAIHCFLYNIDNIVSYISNNIQAAKTPIEKLMVYPKFYRNMYKKIIESGGCPIANTLVEADDTHKALFKLAIDFINRMEKNIISSIEEGKSSGVISENTNSKKIACSIITLLQGGILLAKSTNDCEYIHNAVEQVEFVIQSIMTQ